MAAEERERDGEDEGTVRGVMKFGRGKGGPGEKFNQPQGSHLDTRDWMGGHVPRVMRKGYLVSGRSGREDQR